MAVYRRRKRKPIVSLILLTMCLSVSLAFLSERSSRSWTPVSLPSTCLWGEEDKLDKETPSSLHFNTTVASHRRRQKRRKPTNRRPKYYWTNLKNVKSELRQFWSELEVTLTVTPRGPPPIPNDQLLNHYERHDLRAAIYNHGGRDALSSSLGGARIMPGRWTDAVQESPELHQLLQTDDSLSPDRPPLAQDTDVEDDRSGRWLHQSSRKPKGYWSLRVVIRELYEYVDDYRTHNARPAVWMPRPSELGAEGRDDLRQALCRFGGAQQICRTAGMVPYRDWYYFEGQLELLQELRRYLDEFAASDYQSFPSVSEIHRNGYSQLHALIQFYGGRKFLACRLGMKGVPILGGDDFADLNWGPFDLEFAVRLLTLVRQNQLHKNPPLQNPVLAMPSQSKLLGIGTEGAWLDGRIQDFGGYENVARRLGLAFFVL